MISDGRRIAAGRLLSQSRPHAQRCAQNHSCIESTQPPSDVKWRAHWTVVLLPYAYDPWISGSRTWDSGPFQHRPGLKNCSSSNPVGVARHGPRLIPTKGRIYIIGDGIISRWNSSSSSGMVEKFTGTQIWAVWWCQPDLSALSFWKSKRGLTPLNRTIAFSQSIWS